MDLKTFVAETLSQIVAGVAEAQETIEALGVGAKVNPTFRSHGNTKDHTDPSPVEFDVAITVVDQTEDTETSKVSGGAAGVLAVVGIKIGAEKAAQDQALSRSETFSRVQFSVMLAQPGAIREGRPPRSEPIPSAGWPRGRV